MYHAKLQEKSICGLIAEKYPNKKIRIGGHSKGGNVAIYSAITTSKSIQNRIIKVYNYDGPGFSKNMIDKYGNDKIIDKMETYIPQDSIIGRILNHKEKITIAYSLEKGILQHDIFSWQVLKDDLVRLEKSTVTSEQYNKTFADWINTTTVQQRKIFFDVVFELFYSTDANTFGEISRSLSTNIPKIIRKYGEISPEDRKIVTSMIKLMSSSYFNIMKESQNVKFENMKEKYIKKRKK